MGKIISISVWADWQGCILPVRRKLIETYSVGRQLFGYLAFRPKAGAAVLTFRMDESGQMVLPVESHAVTGVGS